MVSPVDLCVLEQAACGADPRSLRWVAAVLRLRGVSILLVELYLITGIGISTCNMEILHQVYVLKNLLNMPVITRPTSSCARTPTSSPSTSGCSKAVTSDTGPPASGVMRTQLCAWALCARWRAVEGGLIDQDRKGHWPTKPPELLAPRSFSAAVPLLSSGKPPLMNSVKIRARV